MAKPGTPNPVHLRQADNQTRTECDLPAEKRQTTNILAHASCPGCIAVRGAIDHGAEPKSPCSCVSPDAGPFRICRRCGLSAVMRPLHEPGPSQDPTVPDVLAELQDRAELLFVALQQFLPRAKQHPEVTHEDNEALKACHANMAQIVQVLALLALRARLEVR